MLKKHENMFFFLFFFCFFFVFFVFFYLDQIQVAERYLTFTVVPYFSLNDKVK